MARILAIEDNDLMVQLYRFFFDRRGDQLCLYSAGNPVLEDLTKEEGLAYDLAIVDRILPDISGDQVVDRLKAAYPSKQVIKVSGHDYPCPPELRSADAFLKKPFTLKELGGLIDKLLENRPEQQGTGTLQQSF